METMKYENANNILPKELLNEVQKYAAGRLLYIPSGDERRNWGEVSGYREKLQKRNLMICNMYANGMTISDLADKYFLSLDSIKKIIYSKYRAKNLDYSATMESAVNYANAGLAEEWIHSFLLLTCYEFKISEQLVVEDNIYIGLVKFPIRLIQNEEIDDIEINHKLDIQDMPPIIIRFTDNKFYILLHKKIYTKLKKCKVNAYPAFILMNKNDYMIYKKHYEQNLFFIN